MSTTNGNRKSPHYMSPRDRFRVADWLRANVEEMRGLTRDDMTNRIFDALGVITTPKQVNDIIAHAEIDIPTAQGKRGRATGYRSGDSSTRDAVLAEALLLVMTEMEQDMGSRIARNLEALLQFNRHRKTDKLRADLNEIMDADCNGTEGDDAD